jgi:glycosyltransferase involved in cell wall biosynthesis
MRNTNSLGENVKKRLLLGVAKTGRTETLEEYYLQKGDAFKLTVIGQSTWSVPDRSYVKHYNQIPAGYVFRKYEKQIKSCHVHYKPYIWLRWFWNVITNLEGRYDECIAVSQSFGFIGTILKRLGIVKRLTYYCIDFYVNEPIVEWMDSTVCKNADEVWDISERIDLRRKNRVYPKIVPLSFTDAHLTTDLTAFDPNRIIFVGCLMENQGLDLLCKAMPLITKKHPDAYAWIIGDGSYRSKLEELKQGLPISLLGFVDDEKLLCRHLSRSAIGYAMFTLKGNQNILCADPGKIKLYAMSGLPIITSKHYKYEFGIVAEETPESIAEAISYLMSNPDLLLAYRKKSLEWGKRFTTGEILGKRG